MVMWGNGSATAVNQLLQVRLPGSESKLLGYTEIIDNPAHPQCGPSGVYDLILFSKAIDLSAQGDDPILNGQADLRCLYVRMAVERMLNFFLDVLRRWPLSDVDVVGH